LVFKKLLLLALDCIIHFQIIERGEERRFTDKRARAA
jgi:hypothetical protein